MLRSSAGKIYRPRAQTFRATCRLHTASSRATPSRHYAFILTVTATTVVIYGAQRHWRGTVHADSVVLPQEKGSPSKTPESYTRGPLGVDDDGHLEGIAWGSNKFNMLSPGPSDTLQNPQNISWLRDVALRDLALHEQHGACVDVRGNVYQWYGDIDNPPSKPTLSLRGKDIIAVQLTGSNLFALSSSGKIYTLSSTSNKRETEPQSSRGFYSTILDWFTGSEQSIYYTELGTETKFRGREKFTSISAGTDHMLALTNTGRTFTYPINKDGNAFGQLGVRKIDIPSGSETRSVLELIPKIEVDPYVNANISIRKTKNSENSNDDLILGSSSFKNVSIFCDHLFEIPSLKGIEVAQAIAGNRSSFVVTKTEGRVLAWGANEYGQLGLGSTLTLDTITVPSEVALSRYAGSGTRSKCLGITTGGDLTYFIVERQKLGSSSSFDVLACGMGQWGGLGNGLYSNAQGDLVRIKAVSRLTEFSEDSQSLQPIVIHSLSASKTGHAFLTLDTLTRSGGDANGGRDLFAWGLGRDYQLGTGKRTNLASPSNLEFPGSGRFMMMKRKAEVRDMEGKIWKRNAEVEQTAVAGYNASIVFWKIC